MDDHTDRQKSDLLRRLETAQDYVWDKIHANQYALGHPFREIQKEDFLILVLSMLKLYLTETDMLDDYLDSKLVAEKDKRFSLELYYQSLNELIFFYYLLMGCIKNDCLDQIFQIRYENDSPYHPDRKLEYSLLFQDLTAVCVEIKTITCDPFLKEKETNLNQHFYIKKYFRDVDLTQIEEIEKYVVLEESSHDRQLRRNIKRIVEKFTGERSQEIRMVNIGVLVVQYATSMEEFFAYLFHPEKGIVQRQNFEQLDCLVLFSLTARPEPDLQDVYEAGHVVTILLNDQDYIREYLKKLRLDNYVAVKQNGEVRVIPEILPYVSREYGQFELIVEDGYVYYASIERSEREKQEYLEYLKGKRNYPCGKDDGQTVKNQKERNDYL